MFKIICQKIKKATSDSRFSEILTGSIYALAARVAATVVAFATSVVVARFYGAEAMGVLAMVQSLAMLATIVTLCGTSTSILRLIPEHIAKYSAASAFLVYRKTQYWVAGLSLVTGILVYIASGTLAEKVFSKPYLAGLFALTAGFIVFRSLMDLNTQAVRGLRSIRTFAVMQVIPSLTMLVVLLAGTSAAYHPNNPVYAQFAAWLITAMIGVWIMDRAFKRKITPADVVQPMPIKDILDISLPMMMTQSMQFFIAQTGVILLGVYRSEGEVGYYFIAVKLALLTAFVLEAVNSMAAPKFSELYHTGRLDDLFHVARKSAKLIFWTTAPVLLVLLLFGSPILELFWGRDFRVAYPALVLLVLGQFVNSISGSTTQFMNMAGHQKPFRNIVFVAAFINISCNLLLVPRLGINGSAFAGMLTMIFWNISAQLYIYSKHGKIIGYLPLLRIR